MTCLESCYTDLAEGPKTSNLKNYRGLDKSWEVKQ